MIQNVQHKVYSILFLLILLIGFVSASGALSVNSGGSNTIIVNPSGGIEGFFFGIPSDETGGEGGEGEIGSEGLNETIGEKAPEKLKDLEESKTIIIILKITLWLIVALLIILIAIMTDILRRDKKINLGVQIAIILTSLIIISTLAFILMNSLKIKILLQVDLASIGMVLLITIGLISDIARRKKKIGVALQATIIVFSILVLFMFAWIAYDFILTGKTELTLNLIIISTASLMILIVGTIIDLVSKKTKEKI